LEQISFEYAAITAADGEAIASERLSDSIHRLRRYLHIEAIFVFDRMPDHSSVHGDSALGRAPFS